MFKITTERSNNNFKYNQIVFEWEEDFANYFNSELLNMGKYANNKYLDLFFECLLKLIPFSGNNLLSFVLFVRQSHRYKMKGSTPIYLDIHPRWINKIIYDCRKTKKYFVTSYDIYKMIKEKNENSNCCYIPLFISDRYIKTDKVQFKKTIDIVQLGRSNSFLHNCALKYVKEHPEVEYVYLNKDVYVSTKRGIIGDLTTREEYMEFLQSAKISLVSTPASDPAKDFGGIDFFTPRFYESMAADCYLVGQYTNNDEANILSIRDYCPNISTYEEFQEIIDNYLKGDNSELREFYYDFLKNNSSSARAKYISEQFRA